MLLTVTKNNGLNVKPTVDGDGKQQGVKKEKI